MDKFIKIMKDGITGKKAIKFLIILVSLLLSYVFWLPLLKSNAYFLHDDLVHFDSISLWIKQHYPLWGDIVSTNNVHNSMRISRYIILNIYSMFSTDFELFIKVWSFLMTFVALVSNYFVFRSVLRFFKKVELGIRDEIFSYLLSIIYVLSFWSIYLITGNALFTGWLMFPAVFWFALRFYEIEKEKEFLKYAILFNIFAFFFLIGQHVMFYALIVISVFIILSHKRIKKSIIFGAIYLFCNMYWIIVIFPYLKYISILLPYNTLPQELIELTSRNAGIKTLLTLYDPWKHFSVVGYYLGSNIFNYILKFQTFIIVFILSFSLIQFIKEKNGFTKKFVIGILALLLISLTVKGGTHFLHDIYYMLISTPIIGWLFRAPYRAELIFFPVVLILASYIFAKKQKIAILFVILLLITNMLFMIPWRWLYLEEFLQQPDKNEKEFQLSSIYAECGESENINKVFVFNPYNYLMGGGKHKLALNLNYSDLKQIPRYYPVLSSPVPTYDYVFMNNFGKTILMWFYYVPTGNNERKFLLDSIGINAYLLRKDFTLTGHKEKTIVNEYIVKYLDNMSSYKKYENKYNILWISQNSTPILDVKHQIMLSSDLIHLLTLHKTFIFLNNINPKYKIIWDYNNIALIDNEILDVFPFFFKSEYFIKPAKYTSIRSASKGWAFANEFYSGWTFNKPANIIKESNTWQGDYGFGIAFTWAKNSTLKIPFNVDETDNYKLFIRYFKNQKGGKIKITIDNKTITLNTKDQLNKFVWQDLGTFKLKEGEHKITLENVNGFNAVNLFALIPENEYYKTRKEIERLLQNKTIIYIFEGEYDLYHNNTYNYLNINASNGKVLLFIKNNSIAWQNISIIKNGTYKLAVKGKGIFNISVNNKTFIMKLNPNNFTYTGEFNLSNSTYNIKVSPLNIPNTTITLIKKISFENNLKDMDLSNVSKKYEISLDNTTSYEGKKSLKITAHTPYISWSWSKTNPITVEPNKEYIIKGNMKHHNIYGSYILIEGYDTKNKNWTRIYPMIMYYMKIGNSTGWEHYETFVKIPNNVTKIRFLLNGGCTLYEEYGDGITWFDDLEVYRVDNPNNYLDVIWLYSTKNNKIIEQLFKVKEKPAKVINYSKINPTLWEVRINATKPFMLSFAESYDPLWEARIYSDGKLVEKVSPVPLYGVINGFYINETGDLKIIIRYRPQELFEIGIMVSGITFILCILYLLYDWRKEKREKIREIN